MPATNDTLFLNVARLTKPQYTLQIFSQQVAGNNVQAYLQDSYLNSVQFLSLIDTNVIVFNVTQDAASYKADRFTILFNSSTELPLKFIAVNAAQKGDAIEIEWTVSEETSIYKYEIEHSADGVSFSKLAELLSNNRNAIESYDWLDVNAVPGKKYYRVRAIQKDGKFFLSKSVTVRIDARKVGIKVFPNPVKDQQVNIQLSGMVTGKYTLVLFNAQGQEITKKTIGYMGRPSNQIIRFNKKLAAGIYHLRIFNAIANYEQKIFIE
jgi:hypothetical protein